MTARRRKALAARIEKLRESAATAKEAFRALKQEEARNRRRDRERPDGFYVMLGARIRKLRKAQNRSQEDLAFDLCISRASLSNIESGRQQLYVHYALQMADILAVPISELLEPED